MWVEQLETRFTGLEVVTYHGGQRKNKANQDTSETYNVVFTRYGEVRSEHRDYEAVNVAFQKLYDLTQYSDDLPSSEYGTDGESYIPSSPPMTTATDDSFEVAGLVTKFDKEIDQDALLLWVLESPELCKTILAETGESRTRSNSMRELPPAKARIRQTSLIVSWSIDTPTIVYLLHLVNPLLSQASRIVKDMSFGYLTSFPLPEHQ